MEGLCVTARGEGLCVLARQGCGVMQGKGCGVMQGKGCGVERRGCRQVKGEGRGWRVLQGMEGRGCCCCKGGGLEGEGG
jgi:hypothetical protein